jgi:gluconokinase
VIVIVFGVSGVGKTTVGKLLARELDWHFYEADDFHSPANIEKMRRGVSLTEHDRWPWLEN